MSNNRPHDAIPLPSQGTLVFAAFLLIFMGGAVAGLWVGWTLRGQEMPTPEVVVAAPAARQDDGSLVAARVPTPKPSPAPHALPKGSKEERRISATVQPAARPDCPPVRLDLSLVQDDAGGRRVVASSPDGEVIDALDLPIAAALVPPPARPWAAGVSWAPREELGGVWLERDLGPLRLGADLEEAGGSELRWQVRLGWRFEL